MSEPIVFISNQKIKEGKLEEYRALYREVVQRVKESKPGTVAHLAYVDEAGTQASIVHVFVDAEAMEVHVQDVDEAARRAAELVEYAGFVIYGRPTSKTLEMMQRAAGGKIPLEVKSQPVGGYIRLQAA